MKHEKCKVVRLATKGLSNIAIGNETGKLLYFPAKGVTNELHNNKIQTQHLYILSDEEIKEGDWVYNPKGANTDNKLVKISSSSALLNSKQFGWKKIIASTDQSLGLPRPSDNFIKKYCELGGIDEILVEYNLESFNTDIWNNVLNQNYKLKVTSDNTITIKAVKDSWNRAEVEQLCFQAFCTQYAVDGKVPLSRMDVILEEFEDWSKEYL